MRTESAPTIKGTLYREITYTAALDRIPVQYRQPLQEWDKAGMGWDAEAGVGLGVTENKSKVVDGRIKLVGCSLAQLHKTQSIVLKACYIFLETNNLVLTYILDRNTHLANLLHSTTSRPRQFGSLLDLVRHFFCNLFRSPSTHIGETSLLIAQVARLLPHGAYSREVPRFAATVADLIYMTCTCVKP